MSLVMASLIALTAILTGICVIMVIRSRNEQLARDELFKRK